MSTQSVAPIANDELDEPTFELAWPPCAVQAPLRVQFGEIDQHGQHDDPEVCWVDTG